MTIDGRDASVLLKSTANNQHPSISPNGRWMAYESSQSGQFEIYVERYPELGRRDKISTGGGRIPVWSHDGGELFFESVDGRQLFAVGVQSAETFVAGRPQMLFEAAMLSPGGGSWPYDVARDGMFYVIRPVNADVDGGGKALNIILVQNWFEELKRLVPVTD
jgi:eukaryotic-like serine/threonine-protein kinase